MTTHAALDHESRYRKARKIEALLARRKNLAGARLLDIGTGSGLVAEYFLERVGPAGAVAAVDRVRQLRTEAPIEFHATEDTTLPFADESFDIVISNHVIEHVGGRRDQKNHLEEIRRVLKADGLLYLAVPNLWGMVEPHYRLPFLSWLPRPIASGLVRLSGRGAERARR
jgi:ubiquinone/menaquinone biosynthesis C-methylase UbiE